MPDWEIVHLQPAAGAEQGQPCLGSHGGSKYLEFLGVGVSQN